MTRTCRRAISAIAVGLALLAAAPARAGLSLEMTPGIAFLGGDTTYRIGGAFSTAAGPGATHFPLSELRFPAGVTLATLAASARATLPLGSLLVAGSFGRSATEAAGTMEDSDWTDEARPRLRTVFSRSDARLAATLADLRADWRFLETGGAPGGSPGGGGAYLAVGVGYDYRHHAYEAGNVRQVAADARMDGAFPGAVLTYEATWRAPYGELAAGVALAGPAGLRFSLDARVGYSPWARAADEDRHLLRAKLSEGSCDGTLTLLGAGGRVSLGRFFLAAGVTRVVLDTSGTQTQSRWTATAEGPAGPIGTIHQTITGRQTRYDLGLGIAF